MKINKILATLISFAICGISAMAQNSTMTPYSRYGYGILSDNATSAQRAMGGVGYAMNSGRQVNVMNPASYAAIDSLTFLFDMGISMDNLWTSEAGSSTHKLTTGGLDYITMAFPIAKWMGASIGLNTFSSTGYAFGESIKNGTVSRAGSGDINQFYGGLGVTPFKNAYIGANFSYLFGTTINDVYAYTITNSTSLFERFIRVSDWHLNIGAQYSFDVNPDNRLTLGLTYSPAKDLSGETYGIYYDATASSLPDTVGYTKLHGNYSLPATYGAGINYHWKNKLMVEADFTYQPWKDAKFATIENFETTTFANRWKVAAGLQYTPMPRGSYWQRTQYRCGLYFNHDYVTIRGNNVREYGASIGVGLPVPMFKTIISLAFEYKHRQAHPNPLIKEQYFNIALGINFNELWFRKSKIY